MGQCLSAPAASIQFQLTYPELGATQDVISSLGLMNSAITRETALLKECRNTAVALLHSIRSTASPLSDGVDLALIIVKLHQVVDQMRPINAKLTHLIKIANQDYKAFEQASNDNRFPDRTLAGVMRVRSEATFLNPDLSAAIHEGKEVRCEANALCKVLQKKYSKN